jgi:hypothetical protein
MVLKGGVLENKRRMRQGIWSSSGVNFFFLAFDRIIGRVGGTCGTKPQILF